MGGSRLSGGRGLRCCGHHLLPEARGLGVKQPLEARLFEMVRSEEGAKQRCSAQRPWRSLMLVQQPRPMMCASRCRPQAVMCAVAAQSVVYSVTAVAATCCCRHVQRSMGSASKLCAESKREGAEFCRRSHPA